ncbi:uncharacterized protein V2V93DRAFT_375378 [Kockiozyma suomiensis]|uniref:uncharacterized protein n=1 Tax=Kockiozyma suomiensis TaxID=1337062 RepID=UPI00334409F0
MFSVQHCFRFWAAKQSFISVRPSLFCYRNFVMAEQISEECRYIDIGANLTDPMFKGFYHGKQSHEEDFDEVLQRAVNQGVKKMLVTGSNLDESRLAIKLAEEHKSLLYATVGVHPCHALDVENFPDPEQYMTEIEELAKDAKAAGTVKAFGEIGLDYARLHYAPADIQRKYFIRQLDIAEKLHLPLFLHMRDCFDDFRNILIPRLPNLPKGGVVHSFTGTMQEMHSLVSYGFSIGINGCSLKTEEGLQVVKSIPLDRIMLETDAPWCEIRPSHASSKYLDKTDSAVESVKKEKFVKGKMVRGRCEPCAISQVARVVAQLKDMEVTELCEIAWRNSIQMFSFDE